MTIIRETHIFQRVYRAIYANGKIKKKISLKLFIKMAVYLLKGIIDTPVFLFIVYGTATVLVDSLYDKNCSSGQICVCFEVNGYIHADCSDRHLRSAPTLSSKVVSADFGHNKLHAYPTNLSPSIKFLNLTRNEISTITKDAFKSTPFLQNFTISENEVKFVEKGAFGYLIKLQHLDLSHNKELTISILPNISFNLEFTSIKVLRLEKLQCTYGISTSLQRRHVQYLRNTSLLELNIASNRLNYIEFGLLLDLPKTLRILNIGDNVLSFGWYLTNFGALSNLQILNASFESTFHLIAPHQFSFHCNDTKIVRECNSNILPEYRLSGYNSFKEKVAPLTNPKDNVTLYFPPILHSLYFYDNMYKMILGKFHFKNTGKFTHAHLQNNIIYRLEGPFIGLKNLRYVDLSNNFCGHISKNFFTDFENLLHLNLSNNILGQTLENDADGFIFQNQNLLQMLDLAYNRITFLPKNIFKGLVNLKNLNLSGNSLNHFDLSIKHMKILSSLDLSFNRLTKIHSSTRGILTFSSVNRILINLLGNPLQCSCENIDFLSWIGSSKNIIFLDVNNYTCLFDNGTMQSFHDVIKLLKDLEKDCASYTLLMIVTTSLILVILTIILSRIVYRYRWRLRFMFYIARAYRRSHQRQQVTHSHKYYFDAFISYAEENGKFVRDIVEYLEKEHKLRLCIHQRDFIPGTDIADNITNAIHNSQRTVCMLTSDYLGSYWCNYEMNMARMEAICARNRSNVLFFIICQKGITKKIPLKWMDLIHGKSYLEFFGENENEVLAFRTKLAETLQKPLCDEQF
ncbi:toll-like receptor 4 [Saccostrea cucullata]|uniref:toll-like receptor 4 n=1 Tax=Saccostrea cuccullata TaxID=36930 RepID=UPI002ED013C8